MLWLFSGLSPAEVADLAVMSLKKAYGVCGHLSRISCKSKELCRVLEHVDVDVDVLDKRLFPFSCHCRDSYTELLKVPFSRNIV